MVQIDLKYIIDQKALSLPQINHIIKYDFPLYQSSAIDVYSRFKLIAYSKEKLSTNGLTLQKKHPEENAHLERSHRTDDEEFYIPRIHTIKSQKYFYKEAFNYLYYYNCVREDTLL